ncbi:hypothetical protein QFC19_004156 [Naganishia cerealis]|uniref:Uncharacterized protein n=1 Tax=Naganishia cerealis TaxID=610337 RepID=A0ACC2VYR4_9TREE|nr:hypothetical protein QFC19_004156 [Naganishia cerealis]
MKDLIIDPSRMAESIKAKTYQLANIILSPFLASNKRSPSRRIANILLLPFICFAFLLIFPLRPPLPPSYAEEYAVEKALMKDLQSRTTMEALEGKFVSFAPIKETAYEPYHVVDTFLPIPLQWPMVSSRIPMSALLDSVSSGFESFYHKRRAIPLTHWNQVCSSSETAVVRLGTMDREEAIHENGIHKMERMVKELMDPKLPKCVQVEHNPFDRNFFESRSPIDLYESLQTSPVLKHFSFSTRVLSIIDRSLGLLSPGAVPYPQEVERVKNPRKVLPWKNVLALHLRKSSDSHYCESLGERAAPFVGFNKLAGLPGNENIPPAFDMPTPAVLGLYRAKCDPETLAIIARARRMRANHPLLNTIYILSNADYNFIEETKRWLTSDGWHTIITSNDIASQWDDQEVGEAVDTEIARRSGIFVGNGVKDPPRSFRLENADLVYPCTSSPRCQAMSPFYERKTAAIGISPSIGDPERRSRRQIANDVIGENNISPYRAVCHQIHVVFISVAVGIQLYEVALESRIRAARLLRSLSTGIHDVLFRFAAAIYEKSYDKGIRCAQLCSPALQAKSYELSTVLRAHSDDVKCVFPVSSDCILSASRDRTVAVWQRKDTSQEFEVKRLLEGHNGYVNSLEFIPADADCNFDLIVSAGNSTIILFHLFDPDPATFPSSEPVDGLIGHHANVCALSYSHKHRKLISASWDCAARVWSRTADRKGRSVQPDGQRVKSKAGEWRCELVLSGHEAAVWGVAVLESDSCEGLYLTGSADRTLRMYDADGACVRKFDALPEAIRSIACFPDFRNVAVALNDGERKEQKSDGNDVELDIVLEDDRPPLRLRFSKDRLDLKTLIDGCSSLRTTDIIPASTFKNDSFNKSLSRVAFWTAFVTIAFFYLDPGVLILTQIIFALQYQIGACGALVAFVSGLIPNKHTFRVAAAATIISSLGLCIGAAIWTVLIDKNDFLNIVKVQGGKSLDLTWVAFACSAISVFPYVVSACTYRKY